jgi:hypothetical protein
VAKVLFVTLTVALLWITAALASPFDGWTLDELKDHPDFIPLEISPLTQDRLPRESAEPGAPLANDWIGYIDLPICNSLDAGLILIDSQGTQLTCDKVWFSWFPGWAPIWAREAVARLEQRGLITEPCG